MKTATLRARTLNSRLRNGDQSSGKRSQTLNCTVNSKIRELTSHILQTLETRYAHFQRIKSSTPKFPRFSKLVKHLFKLVRVLTGELLKRLHLRHSLMKATMYVSPDKTWREVLSLTDTHMCSTKTKMVTMFQSTRFNQRTTQSVPSLPPIPF